MEKSYCDVEMALSESFFAACTDDSNREALSYQQSVARSTVRSDARKTLLSHRKSCPICSQRPPIR